MHELPGSQDEKEFDQFDDTYEKDIEQAMAFCTKDHDFFARAKADALVELAARRVAPPGQLCAVDVGCGIGLISALLARKFGRVIGVDVSRRMVAKAREIMPQGEFHAFDGRRLPLANDSADVVFAINVFHHVLPADRQDLLADMRRILKPGGMAALFEHNPYNPLTMKVVRACAFDRNAVLLKSKEARERLRETGLKRVGSRYMLFVPFDGWCYALTHRFLGWLPLGAQYCAWGFK